MIRRLKKYANHKLGVIERRIAINIIVFSTSVALIATVLQVYVDYEKDLKAVRRNFIIIKRSYLDSLSTSIWMMDTSQIEAIARGIQSLPNVAYTEVSWDHNKSQIVLGEKIIDRKLESTFELTYKDQNVENKIGKITVAMSLDKVLERSLDRILLILFTNGLKTLVVCVFILYTLRKSITKHLNQITNYLKRGNQSGSLSLDSLQANPNNELYIVSTAINEMEKNLRKNIRLLETHKSSLERKVEENTLALTKAFEEKTSLLRIVCHDLTNPLSIIKGNSELLIDLKVSDEKRMKRYLAIQRASDLMSEILVNVREIERTSSGKRSLELKPVDIKEVFENIQFVFKAKLLEKDIELKIHNHLEPQVRCLADPVTLSNQVLSNLVSNAIKFSYKGSTIELEAFKEKGRIHIVVRDSGVGMSQEHLAEIFDPSAHTTRLGTDGEQGTGFGMPLVKTFVERYGGKLTVESKSADEDDDNHGSSFHLFLDSA